MTTNKQKVSKAEYMRAYTAKKNAHINAQRRAKRTEATRERERVWQAANHEKILQYKKTDREKHAEYYRKYKQEWAARNKEVIAEKKRKYAQEHKEEIAARNKAYREKFRAAIRKKKHLFDKTPRGKELRNERVRRHMTLYPLRKAARLAVSVAVRFNKLPRVWTLACHYCGGTAAEYHHHLGYERPHWLTVRPSCKACHEKLDHHK